MSNLGIQGTMTAGMKEWKGEGNWTANQDKQTLYTTAHLWLIALEGREIINFSTLQLYTVYKQIHNASTVLFIASDAQIIWNE